MLFQRNRGGDWLVVGLGNPGAKYWNTRHNVGFAAMDALADSLHARVDRVKFQGLTGTAELDGKKLVLLKPTTYMNLSGQAVSAAARFYKIPPERILVMFDDISLEPGRIRIRKEGSAGGHNGVKSIISSLGSQAFPRIKIGVGAKPHPDYDLADWVLSVFPLSQREAMAEVYSRAAEAARAIVTEGCDAAMNRFNGK
ncbi:MAG: aminoacyl-tRNA hydrolase [Oscillospiraceae bacterium]|nr:aminoacyl-tRNA hydrolase [Oscillospiraceae bacterium]